MTPAPVHWGTPAGRRVLLATVLGTGLVFLDGTSSNVALPAIGQDLDASVAGLQWTISAYTLALASLILLAGSLGDRFGRRRIFVIGTVWFAVASLLCGLAPNAPTLIVARGLQGVGGALLTPGSLAILQASFAPEDRARAVGAWSGLTGIAAATGPLIGGWLVDVWTWRLIFLTNLPLAVAVVWVAVRHVPESLDDERPAGLDLPGTALVVAGLGLTTWALIQAGSVPGSTAVLLAALVGVGALAGFVVVQRRVPSPLLPLGLFGSRQFLGANLVTLAVYAPLGGLFFLLYLQLQQVMGYSPLQAGLASLPVTGIMLVLSSRAGALAERYGPRVPMTVGPLVIASGLLLSTRIVHGADYATVVLPAVGIFGLGLAITVAPLTATVLAAADPRHVGVASGANNAIARTASLLAVAVLPVVVGLTGDAYQDPVAMSAGFHRAMVLSAIVAGIGGVLALALIRNELRTPEQSEAAEAAHRYHCPIDGPALSLDPQADAATEPE